MFNLPRLIHSLFIVLFLSHGSVVSGGEIPPSVTTLFQLVDQRLSYMEDVASYKWHKKSPIEDHRREQQVLEKSAEGASRFNLQRDTARDFFSLQIEAAKEIQSGWMNRWKQSTAPTPGPDLITSIRPQLIVLGDQILQQIELSHDELQTTDADDLERRFLDIVKLEYLSQATALNLLTTLKNIRLDTYHNRLQHILASGQIRVGTTGDYAPFSWLDKNSNRYRGVDIDLARDLAKSLNVELQLVPTTWPDLAGDFKADKFDLAMSGVSINLQRQQMGFFSQPYHRGGKTPIARCAEVDNFNSLGKIDQITTRVIVNPGGTNFKFANENLSKATITVFNDNQAIFNEIAENRADVMITDAIEVTLQANQSHHQPTQFTHQQSHALCATMPGKTLTVSEKGFWIQGDSYLKEYVDQWLHQRKIEGIVEKRFDHHLSQRF